MQLTCIVLKRRSPWLLTALCISLTVVTHTQAQAPARSQSLAISTPVLKHEGLTNLVQPLYAVRAGGPVSYVGFTNAPETNPVRIAFKSWEDVDGPKTARFTITNGENRSIMIWNVRLQVRSQGPGTDGAGWDTVFDDYPSGDIQAWYKPKQTGTFRMKAPKQAPWRLCLIYSKEPATREMGSSVSAVGNYEVISGEIRASEP